MKVKCKYENGCGLRHHWCCSSCHAPVKAVRRHYNLVQQLLMYFCILIGIFTALILRHIVKLQCTEALKYPIHHCHSNAFPSSLSEMYHREICKPAACLFMLLKSSYEKKCAHICRGSPSVLSHHPKCLPFYLLSMKHLYASAFDDIVDSGLKRRYF